MAKLVDLSRASRPMGLLFCPLRPTIRLSADHVVAARGIVSWVSVPGLLYIIHLYFGLICEVVLLALLDYVSRTHEIAICPPSVVRLSVLQLSLN